MFIAGFLLRLVIAPRLGFFVDLQYFGIWINDLRTLGLHGYVAKNPTPDYLPAVLIILWAIGKISAAPGYILIKLPAIIADLGIAWIAGTVADRIAPPSAKQRIPIRAVVIFAVLFNPAVFALSAAWGQIDAVVVFFLFASLLVLFTGEPSLRRDIGAALLLSVAFAMKPQVCFAFPVMVYALYRRYLHGKPRGKLLDGALRIVLLAVICAVAGILTAVPFGMGPLGLFHVYQHASQMFPVTSANAFNLWGLLGFWRNDSIPGGLVGGGVMTVAGIHAITFGLICFAAATAYVIWQLHSALERGVDQPRAMFAASAVLSLLGFALLTRMHERYMFVAIVLFAPFVFARPFRRIYIALSGIYLLNLWYPYTVFNMRAGAPALHFQPWFDWIFGGFATDPWQKKTISLAVVLIAVVAARRSMQWLEQLEPKSHLAPAPRPSLDFSRLLQSVRGAAEPDDVIADASPGLLARWAPVALAGLTCLFCLIVLRGETRYANNLNDAVLHLPMVQWASGQLHEGHVPLDGWFPIFAFGSSFFHHYQSLPHTLTALLSNITGASNQTVYLWILYLMLALWPISVYVSARLLDWSKWTAACAAAIAPLLVSSPGYGYEHGSYTWQGYGVYSQEWGMWLLPLAWGLTWRAVTRGKQYAAAAAALALTIACHFITGYLALLTIGVWVIVIGKSGFIKRFSRAAIAAGGSLLIASWVLVPLLTDTKYSARTEFYKGTIWNDSYGASQVLSWLFTGELFDFHRFPVVTLLFFVGVFVCIVRWRTDTRARAVLGAFTLSLVLFFGRPTLGRLLNLFPGFGDIQIHRFVMGVDLAAILIAGIGLGWLVRAATPLALRIAKGNRAVVGVAALLLCVVVLAPAWIERARYDNRGNELIRSQQNYDATDGRDVDRLIDVVQQRRDGRVYAGMRGNWGQQYRVGSVPLHAWLADRNVDAIGYVFRTITSLSTDIEVMFDEGNPAHYQMLNMRYVILPIERAPSVPAKLLMQSGRHRLYEVPTSGYFQVVDRAPAVTADRTNIHRASIYFRSTDLASRGIYPGVAFAGAPPPPPTFVGPDPPPGPVGEVITQSNTLQDGAFDATVRANRPAVALLKATYDPRWSVTVDGQSVKPVMMAPSFVGVDVAAGTHTVAFRYTPYAGYPPLLAIGALTLVALVAVPRVAGRRQIAAARVKKKPAKVVLAAGSIALILAAYSNSLHNSFHFDDHSIIVDNLFVRSLKNIPHFFMDARTYSAVPANAVYRPLVATTFAIDYWRGRGLDPVQFHITQLALLIATGILLYVLYVKVFSSAGSEGAAQWAAIFAATLFCVHTGNTQTGNWMNARSELLSGLGVLVAFVMYFRGGRLRRYHLYLIPVVVGAFAKTPVVMFAPLLLSYKLLLEDQLSLRETFSRRAWPTVRSALVASAPAFVLAVVLYAFVAKMDAPTMTWGGASRGQYLLTQTWVWVRYARLFVIPTGMSADTDMRLFMSALDLRVAAGIALLIASIVAIYFASRSRALRPIAFGIAWFWIALVPTSTVFPLAEPTNDHRVFFPFMGLTLAVVWWLAVLVEKARQREFARGRLAQIVTALAIVILAGHAIGTFRRNRVWLNEETLWHDVVMKSPRNGRGLMNYGLTQMNKGDYPVARDYFVRSLALNPNYVYVHINLGIASDALGDTASAERWFQSALNLEPRNPATLRFYAGWLTLHGRAPEAIEKLQQTVELNPADLQVRDALLDLYGARGDTANLIRLAKETLGVADGDAVARSYLNQPAATSAEWYQRATDYSRRNRFPQAAYAYRMAAKLDPINPDALNNLGWALNRLGFFIEAIPPLERAIALRPDFTLARNNLAFAKAQMPRT